MMRTSAWLVPLLAAGLLGGCSAETGPTSTDPGLTAVRKADYEGHVRYLDEAVSPAPLTAEELGDTRYAIPVEVRFYDDWAVAWWVREGVTQVGDPAMAVAAWRIEEHVPTSGDVAPDDAPPTTAEPEDTEEPPLAGAGFEGYAPTLEPSATYDRNVYQDLPGFARLDWLREDLESWREQPPTYHPGCL